MEKSLINRIIEPKQQIPEDRKRFSNIELKNLIFPIIIEQFLALLVGIADTLMVSHVGEAAVSSVSLVNQLNNVFIMVFAALASGGAVVASQYIGSNEREKGTQAASQLVMITGMISVVTTVLLLIFGRQVFGILFGRVEAAVLESGLVYLRISAYSFPFLAVYNACAGLFRSMGKTKVIMEVSIIMNIINVAGNAIGVFALRAGVAGVAYPSLISRIFASVVMMFLAVNSNNTIKVEIRQIFAWESQMILRIFHIAIPNSVENGLFQIAKVALSSIIATFGTVQIAANGVAQSFWSMAALFCLAMGPAFITVIGQYMGAGDTEGAEYYMKKLLRLTYLGGFLWNLLFFLMMPFVLKLYSLSSEAVRLVMILGLLHNTFNALLCPVAFSVANGMRAAGDVHFTMYASIFATVVCRTALSVLFGVHFGLGVIGITMAMVCDWAIKAFLVLLRWRSGKWKEFKVI
ncbi:MAG: MATE family efflux transporter [Lachnospiraceae bacterium]|nr:MATE family efflux transporter [Lachnospiraceae bacterium]